MLDSLLDVEEKEWSDNGHVLVRKPLVGSNDLLTVSRHINFVRNGVFMAGRVPILDPHGNARDAGALQNIDMVHWADPILMWLCTHSAIGAIAAHLLGSSCVRLWCTQLLVKPGGSAANSLVGWHQDYYYWRCAKPARFVTAWIPLQDVNIHNGCLWFLPGSHRWGLGDGDFHHQNLDSQILSIREEHVHVTPTPVEMAAGQVSFHDGLTYHCSGSNRSSMERISLSVHLMADHLEYVPDTPCECHPCVALIKASNRSYFDGPQFPIVYQK